MKFLVSLMSAPALRPSITHGIQSILSDCSKSRMKWQHHMSADPLTFPSATFRSGALRLLALTARFLRFSLSTSVRFSVLWGAGEYSKGVELLGMLIGTAYPLPASWESAAFLRYYLHTDWPLFLMTDTNAVKLHGHPHFLPGHAQT